MLLIRSPDDFDAIECSDGELTNYNHTFTAGLEAELEARPGEVYAPYAAYNFFGYVWHSTRFYCAVYVYREFQEVISAETLRDLMAEVSAEYGYD